MGIENELWVQFGAGEMRHHRTTKMPYSLSTALYGHNFTIRSPSASEGISHFFLDDLELSTFNCNFFFAGIHLQQRDKIKTESKLYVDCHISELPQDGSILKLYSFSDY